MWILTYSLLAPMKIQAFESFAVINLRAVAIRTGTVRRVWFAVRTAVGIFLAIVGEIFVSFDFYNLILINQQ